jgi:hypothetical protein
MDHQQILNSKKGNGRISSIFLRFLQHPQQLIKFVIISGVIFLSSFVAFIFPIKYLGFFIALIIALGVLIIYLRVPPIGLLALIAGGMLVDFEIGTGTKTSINFVVILLPMLIGIWFIDRLIRKREIRFVPSLTSPPLLSLVIVSILAFGIGQFTWFFYARQAPILSQLGGLAIFLLSAGAFIFTANVIKNIKWLKSLTWLFIIVGTIIVLSRFIPILGRSIHQLLPSGATGSLFWLWMIAIAFSQFLINRDLSIVWRILLLGLVVATLYVAIVLGFGWKSGWIPALAAFGVITWLRFRRLRIVLLIGGLLLIGLVFSELIQTDQYSYITRLEAWKIILNEIVKVNPLFGLGPANYHFYTPLFPIMGYWVEFNSHNNYVDILAQIGIIGLFVFLWFAWEVWRLGWGLLKIDTGGFANAYVVGALGGLIGMLVAGMLGDWVIPFVYNVGMNGFRASVLGWVFLGGLVVIDRIYATKNQSSDQGTA